jgi:hypothetical protein
MFSLLFSIGFAASKIKSVSYYMISKDKIKKALERAHLSLSDRGKIISIENRIGIDINGNGYIGTTPVVDIPESVSLNFLGDVVSTFTELSTILHVDREILRAAIEENKVVPVQTIAQVNQTVSVPEPAIPEDTATDVVKKRPAVPLRPNKF